LAGPAAAKPKPSLAAAQHKLDQLNTQVDVLVQNYDKAQETLTEAKRKLAVMQKSVTVEQVTYNRLQASVAQMAAAAYKADDPSAAETLFAAQDASTLLDQVSIFTKLSTDRSSQLSQFVSSSQRLEFAHGQAQQALTDVNHTLASLKAQRAVLEKQVAEQKKLVAAAGGPTPGQGTCNIQASGKALTAIRFACSKLGTPYLWGGTGPRYDCSGLTQAAWRAAGVSLPRTTYQQWTVYTRVSYNQLRPGDLVFFDASHGHVGIYLGGGKMIHSPHTGDVIKISDISSGSYRSQFQGGVHIT
jgi:cell wall-associated NlpC family hydrolase